MYSTVPQKENVFLSSTASLLRPKSVRVERERGGEREREKERGIEREREGERERERGRGREGERRREGEKERGRCKKHWDIRHTHTHRMYRKSTNVYP